MKEKEGKEKPIKPKPFRKVIETYAPAFVWPDVPNEVKKLCKFYHVLRDWLCAIVPKGELREYCKIELIHSDDNEFNIVKVRAVLYSHTYRYVIKASDKTLFVQALKRKPLAGTEGGEETYEGNHLFKGAFSIQSWEYAKNQILRHECVKVLKSSRTEEVWINFNSHYKDAKGKETYAEWIQLGDEIRGHKVYKLVDN